MAEVDIAPHFGAELKDGYRSVDAWVSHGIQWLEDVQQFYRERSAIEKEYSAKLSALAKKYFEKKVKRSSSVSVGDTPVTTPGSLECASMTTWAVQLTTLESRAAEHDRFANDLVNYLAEPVKDVGIRCEELRKQHAIYASKLEKERDDTYADLRRSKTKYDGNCAEVEKARKKVDSGTDFGKQKAQLGFQQHQSDMQNSKNTYLIDIHVTNKQKEKYYHEYVPDLLDSLQDLSESRVAKLNLIWSRAAQIESEILMRSSEFVKHLAGEVPRNKPILDSMMFVRHNVGPWQEPLNFVFEPSPLWLDDDKIATSQSAKTFLRNVLNRRKPQLGEFKKEADQRRRELENARRVKQSIRDGKSKEDEVEVTRAIFAALNQVHEVERRKISAETEVLTIVGAVGDVSIGARNHNFKGQTFKIPTNCDLCGERIWGLSAKGFDCQDCGFTCHSKCELKVPADCPGEQDKEAKKRLKVERQEASHAQAIDEPIPERQVSAAPAPSLNRRDTINSLSTLSSGYSASGNRPNPDLPDTPDGADEAPRAAAPKTNLANRPRVLAPPPTAYVGTSNGDTSHANEKKGKMLYPFQGSDPGEISVDDGKEVVILEPDDGSGWMKVRSGAHEGLVPASYVESVSSSLIGLPDMGSSFSASSVSLASSIAGSIRENGKKKGPAVAPKRGAKKLQYAVALYDYTARSGQEHTIHEGDRFVLIKKEAGEGWSDVEKDGLVKSVPANYIEEE